MTTSPRAPAHLVLLPSASNPPVVQAPRRGRYPRGVVSLRQARERAEDIKHLKKSLSDMDFKLAVFQGSIDFLHEQFNEVRGPGVPT